MAEDRPPDLLDDLDARGLIQDSTDRDALRARLGAGPVGLYCGLDPTGPSLHLGNLQQLVLLRRFQDAGHRPIALAGGATGLIGDPGGKAEERQLLDPDEVAHNVTAISAQMARLLDFDPGPTQARMVNNLDWTAPLGAIEFLRDVGKYMTVNTMLAKDSVRSRIERDSGISFTEFSYMLLQANDFAVLFEQHGCELQVAGSDQWGNITAGIELVRRRLGGTAFGLTSPLLLRSDGTKFGKSESGAVWLDPALTSPYQFFQFFMQVDDADVERLLRRFTLVPVGDIEEAMTAHLVQPQRRLGQRRLAREVTSLVHGHEVIAAVEAATDVLFGGDVLAASPGAFELLATEIPSSAVARADLEAGLDPIGVFVTAGLTASKGEVRRNLGGHYVNGASIQGRESIAPGDRIRIDDMVHGRFLLLRRGKAAHHLMVVAD